MEEENKKRGPKPEYVKGEGDWQEAVKKALHKPPPPDKRDTDRSKPRPKKD